MFSRKIIAIVGENGRHLVRFSKGVFDTEWTLEAVTDAGLVGVEKFPTWRVLDITRTSRKNGVKLDYFLEYSFTM